MENTTKVSKLFSFIIFYVSIISLAVTIAISFYLFSKKYLISDVSSYVVFTRIMDSFVNRYSTYLVSNLKPEYSSYEDLYKKEIKGAIEDSTKFDAESKEFDVSKFEHYMISNDRFKFCYTFKTPKAQRLEELKKSNRSTYRGNSSRGYSQNIKEIGDYKECVEISLNTFDKYK